MDGAQDQHMHHGRRLYAETYPYPSSWADNHVSQSMSQPPIAVPPRRHTNPEYEYADSPPSKRPRSEGEYSAENTRVSVAVSPYSNSFLLQGETDVYFPNHSFGTGTGAQTVGQGGRLTSDNLFQAWPADEQENWPSISDASFVSNTSSGVSSTSDFPPQPLIDQNTVDTVESLAPVNSYPPFRLPIPGIPDVGLSPQTSNFSNSPAFLFRGDAQNVPNLQYYSTNQSSLETSHPPPLASAPQSTVVPTTYPTHFSFQLFRPFQASPSSDPPVSYELSSYGSTANRPLHDRPSLPGFETLNIPPFFNIVDSASDHASASVSAAFPPQESPAGYTLQDTPLQSTTRLTPSNDDGDVSSSTMTPTTESPSACSDRKKRRSFDKIDKTARKETSNTRKIGACLRCRLQRVRCSDSGPGPDFLCRACANVSRLSKKTIYRIVCCRARLNHGALHRSNGLHYTTRFTHEEVIDVVSESRILTVEVTQGICKIPIRLRVRRFEPQEGDVINRRYSENGIIKEQRLQPYCLADVEQTANEFKVYVNDNAFDGLEEAAKDSDELVKATFHMIAKECRTVDGEESERANPLREFLRKFVRMWFALRHESSVGWLCGPETLGSQPGEAPGPGPAIPRMIVAQFDSIRHEKVFKVLVPRVLKEMETLLCSQKEDAWFTVYLASFLLLHQVSKCSSDRARWARDNASEAMPLETRYGPISHPFSSLVENIQECANTLLVHWQFFKKCDLMKIPWKTPSKTQLRSLKPYQLDFIKNSVELVKQKSPVVPTTPSEGCWDHELFWILQLFGSAPADDRRGRWHPPERFDRASHTVGLNRAWPYYS